VAVYRNITETIGNTPHVRINRLAPAKAAAVYAKLESFNPCASVKDRIGLAMIDTAEKDGALRPGMTIVEPTSGNTGIALAMVAAARGYKTVFTMPETMSRERRAILRFFGAELVLTEGAKGMPGAIAKAQELADSNGWFQPRQFDNPANPLVHRETTGPEIVADFQDIGLHHFVAGVGTGGTISGAGEVLKRHFPELKVVAVEPAKSPVLSGGKPGPHRLQGIGAGFVPAVYDSSVVDEIIQVSEEDALRTAAQLAVDEGILAGISSGASMFAALQVAVRAGIGKNVLVILPDTGERYLSTDLFAAVRENG
jgi:cysteine synthase A